MKKGKVKLFIFLLSIAMLLTGCRQSQKVSYNLKRQADDFNIRRRITIINTWTDKVLLQMEGLISISVDDDGDLNIVTEYDEDKYTLQYIHLSDHITYLTEQISTPTDVSKYAYEIVLYPMKTVLGFDFVLDNGEQKEEEAGESE